MELTNEEIRIKLAEWMDDERPAFWWCHKCQSELAPFNVTFHEECAICRHPVVFVDNQKNYPSDLNAVRKVELKLDSDESFDYINNLEHVMWSFGSMPSNNYDASFDHVTASPLDRCKALIKTLKL